MTRLVFETKRMKVAELGEESSVPDLFGELTTQNSLVFDLDEDDEIYDCLLYTSDAADEL